MLADREHGSSLLAVVLMTSLLAALAVSAALLAQIEVRLAAHHRRSAEALAGAEAGVEVVVASLRTLDDWSAVVSGGLVSPLSQGSFAGRRAVPGGGTLLLCCGFGSLAAELADETSRSPSPARRNIRWFAYLWTTLEALAPTDPPSRVFLVVWVGNDEADASGAAGDTNGIVLIRSQASHASGIRRAVETRVGRIAEGEGLETGLPLPEAQRRMRVAILGWREMR